MRDLTERVTEWRVTGLLGQRRYGKTSVLRRVTADLSEVPPVWVDLHEVPSMADVAVRFDEALADTAGRFAENHNRRGSAPARLLNGGAPFYRVDEPATRQGGDRALRVHQSAPSDHLVVGRCSMKHP